MKRSRGSRGMNKIYGKKERNEKKERKPKNGENGTKIGHTNKRNNMNGPDRIK